jgi:hypothetical protein
MSEETLPEICPFDAPCRDITNGQAAKVAKVPSLVLGPVPVPVYRLRSPIVSLDWRTFSLGTDVLEYELYTPFDGATPNIRPINKITALPLRMHIFTPAFCTNFPHLTVDVSILTNPATTVDMVKRQSKYLDMSMFGAGLIQSEFRAWM